MKLRTALFDIETDGLNPSVIWCLSIREAESDFEFFAKDAAEIADGIRLLENAERCVAHYGIRFDYDVITRLAGFKPSPATELLDSHVMCSVLYGDIKETFDFEEAARTKERKKSKTVVSGPQWKSKYFGSHSLAAWGYRLGNAKGDYAEIMKSKGLDPWASYSAEMGEYCRDDTKVLRALWNDRILPKISHWKYPKEFKSVVAIEHFMERRMFQLERSGVLLNKREAIRLRDELRVRQVELAAEVEKVIVPRVEPEKWIIRRDPRNQTYPGMLARFPENPIWHPRSDAALAAMKLHRERWGLHKRARGLNSLSVPDLIARGAVDVSGAGYGPYVLDGDYCPVEIEPVKVTSRDKIAARLMDLGWVPTEVTEKKGSPSITEPELEKLAATQPIADALNRYLTVVKRLGMLSEGKKAWLTLVDENDFIHPVIMPCAAVTSRAAHHDPNISQVASLVMTFNKATGVEEIAYGEPGGWGAECRALFYVPEGFVQVGADLAGIELRAFAHYLHKFDKGAFADVLLNSDPHEHNRKIIGFANRTDAKRFMFGWMYGAGDEMLGFIINPAATTAEQVALGRKFRHLLTSKIEGVADLISEVSLSIQKINATSRETRARGTDKLSNSTGYIRGLDMRLLPVRGLHAALNTLLQSAGAIIAKYWIYFIFQRIRALGWKYGYDGDYTFMLWSHDEVQFACRPDKAKILKQICETAAEDAGKHLGVLIPIKAKGVIGANWLECH